MPPTLPTFVIRVACAALLGLLLAACAQQSTVQTTVNPQDSRSAPESGEPDRRAALRMELASLYFSRGQYETALEETRLALAARPDLGAVYNLRGLIYGAMGDERQADENYQRALAINPRDVDTMHNHGWYLCQRGRFDDAARLFDQALAQPNYRDVPRTLMAQGVCLARAGKLPEAEQKLQRAYEIDAGNPTVALNLSEVLYRRGDFERARFYIRRINTREDLSNAQTLWLALRIENRMGNRGGVEEYARQLRSRFPQSPEAQAFERGRIDE
jgi:type IV pilus assembly protein PilF